MRFVVVTLWFLALADLSLCARKIWRYNTDITDQANWNKEEEDDECEGVILPSTVTFAVLPELEAKQIVFPKEGEFALTDDTDIRFNNVSEDKINCAYMNSTIFNMMYWSDVSAWTSKDLKNVEAIPHAERAPCQYDDVVFPRGLSTSSITLNYATYKMKSLTFGNDSWSGDDLPEYSKSEIIKKILMGYVSLEEQITIKGEDCKDPTGCVCGNDDGMSCWMISYVPVEDDVCLEKIQPVGFCNSICGAYILFKPVRKTFRIDSMRKALETYESLTHVSKVLQNEMEYIQIIFTEKEFEGASLDDAEHLYARLLEDSSFGAKKVKLVSSQRKDSGSSVGMAFGIIFGIAVGCLGILLIYSPRSREVLLNSAISLRDRLGRLDLRNRDAFTVHFLARYRRSEDAGLFEEASDSVVTLERSFENPLHDEPSPSTSSTSCDTNEEETKSKTTFDNPLFKEHKELEMAKVGEDGELVDLTY